MTYDARHVLGAEAYGEMARWAGSVLPGRGRELSFILRGGSCHEAEELLTIPDAVIDLFSPEVERYLLRERLVHGVAGSRPLWAEPSFLETLTGCRVVSHHPVDGELDIWVGDRVLAEVPGRDPFVGDVLSINSDDVAELGIDPVPLTARVPAAFLRPA